MRGRLRAAVGWLLIALALWGLFRVADALPGDRYELRFDAPLTAGQAEAFCRAAGTSALDLALWREDPVTVTTPLGRSAETRQAAVYGSPALCFPVGYLYGTAPGAGQQDGCALSAGLAEELFGSRQAVGLALTVGGKTRRVTGVLAGEDPFLLCPEGALAGDGYTAASLGRLPGSDPRGTVQDLIQSAGLDPDAVALLPVGTLGGLVRAAAWLPLVCAALRLAGQLMRPWRPAARRGAVFCLLLLGALALPALLGALPRWLIPARWSDGEFWSGLGQTAAQSLLAFLSLSHTARDRLLARQCLSAAACLGALWAGVLLTGRGTEKP